MTRQSHGKQGTEEWNGPFQEDVTKKQLAQLAYPHSRLGAIKGPLELLGVELDHLPHGFGHGLPLFLVRAGVPLRDLHRKNLPTHTKLVDQPAALPGLPPPLMSFFQ